MKIREVWIGTNTERTEDGEEYTCEYALVVREVEEDSICEHYGVQVTMKQTGETARILDITPFASQAMALGECLRRNTVTPCTLREVIDDWL